MLSYQHKYHAGNHGDVLKHIVLLTVIKQVAAKPKPFFALDTHAGEGVYAITSNEKSDDVVASRIIHSVDMSETGMLYRSLVENDIKKGFYPGSPLLIKRFTELYCQQKVSFHANELSVKPFEKLKKTLGSHVFTHNKNAFDILNQLLPPMPRRGFVLIDPPYEQKNEYEQVENAIFKASSIWSNGIYMIWYPLLSPKRLNRKTGTIEANQKAGYSERLLSNLGQKLESPILDVRLKINGENEYSGMYGSGVCIINPPWQADVLLEKAMKDISAMFDNKAHVSTAIEWINQPE